MLLSHRTTKSGGICPVEHWHEALGAPTLADAILDRLLHNAYKITLRGESMRKRHAPVKTDMPAM